MKILHIISSAFNYFDVLRHEAFEILEQENTFEVESNAITLEYGTTSKKVVSEIKTAAPTRQFLGQQPMNHNMQSWDDFDVINLHAPFFGAAGKILKWVNDHPEKIFIVTYHYDFVTTDFFSIFIKFYNFHYLPKMFAAANMICLFYDRKEVCKIGVEMVKFRENVFILGLNESSQDIHNSHVAEDLLLVYNSIILSNTN